MYDHSCRRQVAQYIHVDLCTYTQCVFLLFLLAIHKIYRFPISEPISQLSPGSVQQISICVHTVVLNRDTPD